jgi:hydroxypyruvate reductase/glycerate 2-kinase
MRNFIFLIFDFSIITLSFQQKVATVRVDNCELFIRQGAEKKMVSAPAKNYFYNYIMEVERLMSEIYYAALRAVDPYESTRCHMDKIQAVYQSGNFNRIFVAGFGKASCPMAKAVEELFCEIIGVGIIITKYHHCLLRPQKMHIVEAGHPLPDENGLIATKEMVNILKVADEKTLIVCLISGGGSSLLVAPCEGISLDEKQKITALLLNAGANIHELNTVRKHLSQVKGGRLAEIAHPAPVISLILSDVIGDRLDVIASGPTVPDSTTYEDALRVLAKYNLLKVVPGNVLDILNKGSQGMIPETPKENNVIFEKVQNIIVGNNKRALETAREKALELGLHAEIISSEVTGEARDAGRWLAKVALEAHSVFDKDDATKMCLISGGETTVTVTGRGTGGRNMEFALSFAMEIEGIDGITLLSAGTDGTDGPTDAAGAIVNGNTIAKAMAMGVDPGEYLRDNDSYAFFKKIDELFVTGPTGTNVMDIQIVIIE